MEYNCVKIENEESDIQRNNTSTEWRPIWSYSFMRWSRGLNKYYIKLFISQNNTVCSMSSATFLGQAGQVYKYYIYTRLFSFLQCPPQLIEEIVVYCRRLQKFAWCRMLSLWSDRATEKACWDEEMCGPVVATLSGSCLWPSPPLLRPPLRRRSRRPCRIFLAGAVSSRLYDQLIVGLDDVRRAHLGQQKQKQQTRVQGKDHPVDRLLRNVVA